MVSPVVRVGGWMLSLAVLALFNACGLPLETPCTCEADKSAGEFAERLTEEQRRIVRRYAPVFFQEIRPLHGEPQWDIPTRVDFDGDRIGNNNEQSLRSGEHSLPVAIYYALVETRTHYFVTYSVFHPLDWSTLTELVPYSWHENDMENLQVVVRKATEDADESVVLLACQAHLWTGLVSSDDALLYGTALSDRHVVLVDDDGVINPAGTHPVVVIRSGGHALYDFAKEVDDFYFGDHARVPSSLRLTPGDFGSGDEYATGSTSLAYALESTHDNFYLPYFFGEDMGDGKLFDGEMNYADELQSHVGLPRFFDSDRVSGPGKSDAGILPFAFSFWLTSSDLGVLFFNPAKKYTSALSGTGDWSREYVYHPYLGDYFGS